MAHKNEVQVDAFPECSLCIGEAHYDGKTLMGPWGYLCDRCFNDWGVGLGPSRGQRLVLRAPSQEAPSPRTSGGYPEPTVEEPGLDEIGRMVLDGDCWATDGCTVEPDGVCPHGHPSWLLALGMI